MVLEAWNKSWLMGGLKADTHSIDAAELSAYFTLENCLEGLHVLVHQLFGGFAQHTHVSCTTLDNTTLVKTA